MTGQEAWSAIRDGYFVTKPGYVYGDGIYFAHGTFPSCVRLGNITKEVVERSHNWELIPSFKDLILHTGYYPSWSSMVDHVRGTHYEHDALMNEHNMIKFMIDSPYSTEDFQNPFRVKEIWEGYFNAQV